MPVELTALTTFDLTTTSQYSNVPNRGNVIPIQISSSEQVVANQLTINLTSIYANTSFSLINLTPTSSIVPSLITGITDNVGTAAIIVNLTPVGVTSSATLQAIINSQYSNTISISYSPSTTSYLIGSSDGSPSTFLGINKGVLDSIINSLRDVLDLLRFDEVGHKGLGTADPEGESVALKEEELTNIVLLASAETAKSVSSWFSNVYLKTVTNPTGTSEYVTAQTNTTLQATTDLASVMKSSPSVDLAKSLLRYRSIAEWGAKTAKAVLDSLNAEYGSGNEVKNTSGLYNLNANSLYFTSNTAGHLDFPSFVQTSKLALQQSNVHQFQSDLFQVSSGDIWMRAEDLCHVHASNTLRENYSSLKEISRNAELIAGGMTIYGDTLYLQAGQPSLTAVTPDNPDPLIYPTEVGNFMLNVVNGAYQKADAGFYTYSPTTWALDSTVVLINSTFGMSAVLGKGGFVPKQIAPLVEPSAYPKQPVVDPVTSPIQIGVNTPLPPQIASNLTLNKEASATYKKKAVSSTSAFFA